MAAPKLSLATQRGRYYRNLRDPEQPLVSVTNVIHTMEGSDSLVEYAAREVAEYAVRELPRVTDLARKDPLMAVQHLRRAADIKRDRAAMRGTLVHELAEMVVHGLPLGDVDPEAAPYVRSFLQFLDDWEPEFEATETTVVNYTHGYAGTTDAMARFPRVPYLPGLLILDYKTTRTGPYLSWALQLAGLADAEVLFPEKSAALSDETPMPQIDGGLILHLRPDGYSLFPVDTGERTRAEFRRRVPSARWAHADGHGAIANPLHPGLLAPLGFDPATGESLTPQEA